MGKKVNAAKDKKVNAAKEVQAQTEVKAQETKAPKHYVKAVQFLKGLRLDWVLEGLKEGDLDILKAQVSADNSGAEWASWWVPYRKVDGAEVPGISWGVSAPLAGGLLILRLVESGQVKATLKVYRSGKGVLTGSELVVKALMSRPDLPPWTDQDTASML